jgi:hypothetical protein
MVGASLRRSALVLAVAVLALVFVSRGVPGGVHASSDRSTEIFGLQAGPLSPVPALRHQPTAADWKLRAERSSASRGAVLTALVSILWLLGLGPAMARRTRPRSWTKPSHRRYAISRRAPPPLRLA